MHIPLTRLLTASIIVSWLIMGSGTATAAGQGGVVFHMPPEGSAFQATDFAEAISGRLGVEPEYTLDPISVYGAEVQQRNGAALEVSWSTESGGKPEHITIEQNLSGTRASGDYVIGPNDLHVGIEIWSIEHFLIVVAPPGALPSDSHDPRAAAEDLARSLSLPPASPESWDLRPSSEGPAPFRVFGAIAPRVPGIYLDCACQVAVRHDADHSPNINHIAVYFSESGAPIGIQASPWVDLGNSSNLDLTEAEDLLRENLKQAGDEPLSVAYTRLDLVFDDPMLVYEWSAVFRETVGPQQVRQDAHTGQILEILGPKVSGAEGSNDERSQNAAEDAPGPGPLVVVAGLVCLAFRKRRYPW